MKVYREKPTNPPITIELSWDEAQELRDLLKNQDRRTRMITELWHAITNAMYPTIQVEDPQ